MRWMWIDRVVELERGKRMVAVKNVSLAEEHLHDHFASDEKAGLSALPVMPACFIIEGMAQTGGVLFGHANDFAFNVVLAKISRAELAREATPGCTLRYTAEIERMDAVAMETFKLGQTPIFFKTVIRTVTKGLLAAEANRDFY